MGNNTKFHFYFIAVLASIFITLNWSVSTVKAATLTVSDTCTLAQAITAANDGSNLGAGCAGSLGADTIVIPIGIINFTVAEGGTDNALPVITSNITFQGAGTANTIIRRISSSPDFRLFEITGGNVTFENLTIESGRANTGGAIRVSGGTLITNNVLFRDNISTSNGGALWLNTTGNQISNSRFEGNRALSGGGGIAVVGGGGLTLTNSTLISNLAQSPASGGGGLLITGVGSIATIDNTVFQSNSTAGRGAGILNQSTLNTTNNTRFISNIATNQGGGIYAQAGTTNIETSTFRTNVASDGGGIFLDVPVTASITRTTIDSNSGTSGAGGMRVNGGVSTITRTTISRNQANNGVGGLLVDGSTVTITNSTLSTNSGQSGAVRLINSGTINVQFSTIYSNVRQGAVNVHAGGFNIASGTANINNSILGNNSGVDCLIIAGASVSGANNLSQSGCNPVGSLGIPTGVLGLLNNGGGTETHALQPTSNAIGQANVAACTAHDQRGEARPFGAGCDIGAFELQGVVPTITINSGNITTAFVGVAYNRALTAVGGTPPYTWTATTTTPAGGRGLALNSNGTITGTPTSAGNVTFDVSVTDGTSVAVATVIVPVEAVTLTLTPMLLPNALQNIAYQTIVAASGGSGNYTYSIVDPPPLPAGISTLALTNIGNTTARLNGTFMPGTYNFQIRVVDNVLIGVTQDFTVSLTVLPTPTFQVSAVFPVNPAQTVLPPARVNELYNGDVFISGGTPPYEFIVNIAPTGLTLVPNGNHGRVTGIPLEGGTAAQVEFRIRDANGFTSPVSSPFSVQVTIDDKAIIEPTELPTAALGIAYDYTLQAQRGFPPYRYALAGGSSLPPGLSLAQSGRITGTLTSVGASPASFTVIVTDNRNVTSSIPLTMPLSATPVIFLMPASPLNGANVVLPAGAQTVAYTQTFVASGGATTPYTYTASGGIPPGFSINPTTGELSGVLAGTIAVDTTYTFTVQAEDSAIPANTGTRTYELLIRVAPQITILPDVLPLAYTNLPYTVTLSATGGTAPYTFTTSTLPAGLTLTGNTISGTPTGSGSIPIDITARDANGQEVTKSYILEIGTVAPITISPNTLAGGMVGNNYVQQLTAANGDGNYVFSTTPVSPNPLPPGLTLDANGRIAGVPTSEGTFTFNVFVQDGSGRSAIKSYSITIDRRLQVVYLSSPEPNATIDLGVVLVGSSSTRSLVISEGGIDPLTVSVTGGQLVINDEEGVFSLGGDIPPFTIEDGGASKTLNIICTPSVVGIYQATLVMNTNDPNRVSVSYTLSCSGARTLSEEESQFRLPSSPATIGRVFFVNGLAHRTGPYLGATMLGIIRPNVDYPVYGKSDDEGGEFTWYLLEANEKIGWASGRYFEVLGSEQIPVIQTDFEFIDDARDFGVGGITYTNLNIRRRPSPRSEVLITTEWGARFAILGRTRQAGMDQWYHVRYITPDNRTIVGWVAEEWVQFVGFIDVDVTPIR